MRNWDTSKRSWPCKPATAREPSICWKKLSGKPKGVFVGSGGETSYRAQWLIGVIGDLVGNQSVSCGHYFAGVSARPAFEPSVVGLLKQRLPADVVDSMQWELCHLVRREPRYLEPVFYFLLVHRAFSAAQRLMDTLEIAETQRARSWPQVQSGPILLRTAPGEFGRANRRHSDWTIFCSFQYRPHQHGNRRSAAVVPGFSVGLEPHGFALIPPQLMANGDAIQTRFTTGRRIWT